MLAASTSRAVWYLMRASGVVTLVLFTLVVVLGIATANRHRIRSMPVYVTAAVHRSISLLAVAFLAVHIATALVDPYAGVNLLALVVPTGLSGRPFWVGFGAVALDLILALVITSVARRHVNARVWRRVHWVAYAAWPVALLHTVGGTDTATVWMRTTSVSCVAVVAAAVARRVCASPRQSQAAAATSTRRAGG
jgi:methionine sulfoxide reductase heme-binding subunit